MRLTVDDSAEDLRFKVGTALEYDRELDIRISGKLARVAVKSAERVRPEQGIGCLVVQFLVPNPFRLDSLEISDDDSITPEVTLTPKLSVAE